MIGKTLLHYRILNRLGKGGMGEVYVAEDTRLKRSVALKILPPDVSHDPQRLQRFQREAEAIAALNHPNVVTIFSVEEAEGIHFLTMELVEGETLDRMISPSGIDIDAFLRVVIPISEALAAAHGKGIVHRDLKPGNIMLSKDGRIKVLDFGLAKWLRGDSDPDASKLQTADVTREGVVMGTAPYMSPEQATGREIDARSDIFSFGVVLYQLASGRLPFNGPSAVQILAQILSSETPAMGAVPASVEHIIRRCLEKDPDRRYSSMNELLADLKSIRDSAAPAVVQRHHHNLPLAVSSFVGREQELESLNNLLATHRLITITGASGSGKSRLALEAALRNVSNFEDGVWQVDFAPVTSDLVVQAVAGALEVKEESDQVLLELLKQRLRERKLLLVMDNCEHVLEEAAVVMDAILKTAPDVRILATSREVFHLSSEFVWTLPPLSLVTSRGTITVESAARSDAVKLFLDRATSRDSRFKLTDSNVEAIAGICSRLDGIPLAIELAAARIKVMSAADILKRLEDCFRLLTVGSRTGLQRHQTMRAAVDWSYELLSSEEQLLFHRLAVFRGGFDLEAAENICGFDPILPDQVMDLLLRLVDKSLAVSERTDSDQVRYRILEPLRQYAMENLAATKDNTTVARRHLDYFAEMAEQAYRERIESEASWLNRLEQNHDNFRAALAWASDHDPADALRLAGALAWFWVFRSHFTEGRRWLREVLAGPRLGTRETARALCGAGYLAAFQGDHGEQEPAQEGLAIWRELGEKRELALALDSMGWHYFLNGNNPEARDAFEEAVRIFQELGDQRLVNHARLGVCQILVSEFDAQQAEPMAEECLPVALQYDDPRDIHFAHHFLADCALIRGDAARAREKYADSLRAALRIGDRIEISFEVEGIAMALAGLGHEAKALRLSGAIQVELESLRFNVSVPFWEQLRERYFFPAEKRMGVDAAEAEKRIGRSMEFEDAIDYALQPDSPPEKKP